MLRFYVMWKRCDEMNWTGTNEGDGVPLYVFFRTINEHIFSLNATLQHRFTDAILANHFQTILIRSKQSQIVVTNH